jgi:hypothetical protein
MSNPGPPGDDERELPGPDLGMGMPESGTQHATSTDFEVPLNRPADPLTDPLTDLDGPIGTEPVLPAATPAEPVDPTTTVPASEPAAEAAGGAMAKVKAFADERPGAFLAAALAVGWLVGKLLSSSGDDEDEDG